MTYVAREEALPTIRGRVRFAEQLRRRYDLPLPVEVAYDDFTTDTEANRLVKAALRRVERLRLRRAELRRRTVEALAALEGVSDVNFDPRRLPTFAFTRLNQQYRTVLEFAALLVRNTSVELHPGAAPMSSILFDMNVVFEDFVSTGIGDELRRILPAGYPLAARKATRARRGTRLCDLSRIFLSGDGSRCVFVGDAKYKETEQGEVGRSLPAPRVLLRNGPC